MPGVERKISMEKKSPSQSGLRNPTALLACVLWSVGVFLTMVSFAAVPPSEMNKHARSLSLATNGWGIVDSPSTSNTQNNVLNGVTCTSASDCWVVGVYFAGTGPYQTLIEHWDGTSWTIAASPNTSGIQNNFLFGVACPSAASCWAVGDYFVGSYPSDHYTLIEHWDGTSWSIVPSPNPDVEQYLNSVTCTSGSDCWAVGFCVIGTSNTANFNQTLIEHWDGTSWTVVTSPNTATTQNNFLNGVTCTSASDCWAIGDYDVNGPNFHKTLIEHWDGRSWSLVTSPDNSPNQDNELLSVACTSASDCWTTGYYVAGSGVRQTLIEHWDGTSWTIAASPNTSGMQNNSFFGVACPSAASCWAVGQYYDGGVYQTLIDQWNGTSWTAVSSPNAGSTQNNYLSGVTCTSASHCWAVGYYYTGSIYQTLIEEYAATIPPMTSVVSRMTQGNAGTFDVDLPVAGNLGIECRSGGANGDYTIIFTFSNTLTSVGGASVTSETGSVRSSNIDSTDTHNYIVNLTGVTNAQVITVGLTNVTDSAGNFSSAVSASVGVLISDTNGDGFVNSADISQTKSQSGHAVTSTNFREDVNTDGFTNSADISLVKSKSGTALP
jgi:hypothetical protein